MYAAGLCLVNECGECTTAKQSTPHYACTACTAVQLATLLQPVLLLLPPPLTMSFSLQGRCGAAGASVIVTVTDLCPECAATTEGEGDHFDLNALSFNQLAPMLNGRIDVNYRLVACTPPSSLQVQVDGSGGDGLWLRLLITVSHHAMPAMAAAAAAVPVAVAAAVAAAAAAAGSFPPLLLLRLALSSRHH